MVLAAANNGHAMATGRVAGDEGQPSSTGYYDDKSLRHAPAVYKRRFPMKGTHASDISGLNTNKLREGGDVRIFVWGKRGLCV